MHLAYTTFKHLNSPENHQDAASSRKAQGKLLLRWVISLIVVYVAEPLAWLFDWVPLFPLVRVGFVGLVLLEGKFAVGLGRRCEARLDELERKCGWMLDYLEAGSVALRVKMCIWMLKLAKPVLTKAKFNTTKELVIQCKACIATVESAEGDDFSPLSPDNKKEMEEFSSSPPLSPPSLDRSPSILSFRKLETSDSQSSLKADKSFAQATKPPIAPIVHTRTLKAGKPRLEAKESVWTVSILLLTKKASRAEPALYTPYSMWFEPGRKMLFWKAVGEDMVHSELVLSAKIPAKSTLLIHIECADGVKVVRFVDTERFATWSQRLIKAVGGS